MKPVYTILIASVITLPGLAYFGYSHNKVPEETPTTLVPSLPTVENSAAHEVALKDNSQDNALKANVNALGLEVAHLRAELASLRKSIHTQQLQDPQIKQAVRQESTKSPEAIRAETQAAEEGYLQKQGEALEIAFNQQTRNSDWSSKVEQLIQEALASDKITEKDIVAIDCRASMCRVELLNEEGSQSKKISQFPIKVSEELPNIRVNQTDEGNGITNTVLYLSKEQIDFPSSDS